ncbi:hypothetical protein ABVT39_001905 [Epinephelus coioides]
MQLVPTVVISGVLCGVSLWTSLRGHSEPFCSKLRPNSFTSGSMVPRRNTEHPEYSRQLFPFTPGVLVSKHKGKNTRREVHSSTTRLRRSLHNRKLNCWLDGKWRNNFSILRFSAG